MAKVSLPEEAVTYDIAHDLGFRLEKKGKYEEVKVFWLAALEGRKRVLGDEHKDTIASLNNMGALLGNTNDYEGELGYYQQAVRLQEIKLGRTHPSTLMTNHNMAIAYEELKDFVKAEEMYRRALDGFERSLGKENMDTHQCAYNLAVLLAQELRDKEKTRLLIQEYPQLMAVSTLSTSVAALLG